MVAMQTEYKIDGVSFLSPPLQGQNRSHMATGVLSIFHRRQHVLGLERITGAFSNFPHNYGRIWISSNQCNRLTSRRPALNPLPSLINTTSCREQRATGLNLATVATKMGDSSSSSSNSVQMVFRFFLEAGRLFTRLTMKEEASCSTHAK